VTSRFSWSRKTPWLAIGACVPAVALAWLGFGAIVDGERAAETVASKRAQSASALILAALARDMRGAQLLVLSAIDREPRTDSDVDLLDPIGSGLARYAYTDAFFSWHDGDNPDAVTFYSRAERPPHWLPTRTPPATSPLVMSSDGVLGKRLLDRVSKDAAQGHRSSVFSFEVGDGRYQVVAALSYADARPQPPTAVLGFLVSLDWVRANYFGALIAEVARIEGGDRDLVFAVFDDRDRVVAGGPVAAGALGDRRAFALAFFDPLVVAVDPPGDLELPSWAVAVDASGDAALAAAGRTARRTLAVAAAMWVVLGAGLLLTVWGVQTNATLAAMRADFVSAVTHELKTPIANMRAINETLAAGRGSAEMTREYARLGNREAARLTRLVENLLAYARTTDVADAYTMELLSLETVVDKSLQEFAPVLKDGGFEVHVDLPEELPPVRGDATALGLMLNNLVDNAIRYSSARRRITVAAHPSGADVVLSVADQGIGIPKDEVSRVTGRFFRGRNAVTGGSGLGLAIVGRIVADHRGSLAITSEFGVGTTVSVTLHGVPS